MPATGKGLPGLPLCLLQDPLWPDALFNTTWREQVRIPLSIQATDPPNHFNTQLGAHAAGLKCLPRSWRSCGPFWVAW